MGNFYDDNDDLQYYVDRGIDWEPIVELTEHGFRAEGSVESVQEAVELYRDILREVGKLTAEEIAPHAATIDQCGVRLVDGRVELPKELVKIFDTVKAMDLHGLSVPRELGGSNCPLLVYFMSNEMFGRADVSVMAHHSFHCGIAMALLYYSIIEGTTSFDRAKLRISSTRFRDAIDEIVRGDAWGCMDITEPNAGSDMGALRCRAAKDADGHWKLTGQKIFITSGHGKYHVVVARSEPTAAGDDFGLRGLSLFLVPLFEDGADGKRTWHGSIDRLEEKLGQHGSVTATINFDDTPAQLIGKQGEGFRMMLLLMNAARIGVGMESIGLCEASYRLAREYAAGRPSMGKTIDRHEMIADYLDEMRTDIQGLRAIGIVATYHEELRRKSELAARFADDETQAARFDRNAKRHAHRARRLTPLFKYLASEKAVEMAQRCVQIHGGVGYTREFGAEKLLRDAMVMPIYEGTSQIQALMAMKDALQDVMRAPQAFVREVAQARWRSVSAVDALERRAARLRALALGARQHLISKTAARKLKSLGKKPIASWTTEMFRNWDPKRDFSFAMLHAERLTRLMADVAIVDALLEQRRRHPDRADVLRRYLERAEPRARMLHEQITTTGGRLLEQLRTLEHEETTQDVAE